MKCALLLVVGLLRVSSKVLATNAHGREQQNNVKLGKKWTRKVTIYQHMLPEKNNWYISDGKEKKICKGGPYSTWYTEAPTNCALPSGSYSITCCDTRMKEGWSGGYVDIHGKKEKL